MAERIEGSLNIILKNLFIYKILMYACLANNCSVIYNNIKQKLIKFIIIQFIVLSVWQSYSLLFFLDKNISHIKNVGAKSKKTFTIF